jgi:uncharacterized membrane protein
MGGQTERTATGTGAQQPDEAPHETDGIAPADVWGPESLTRRNVERIQALEERENAKASPSDRAADAIANFSGSIAFVWVTTVLIGGWMLANLLLPKRYRLDPFPFPLLTLVLSIEAIFLSIFILMSQNRAARVTDKRSHLDLQLTMLSEQENTKMLSMLEAIGKAVGATVTPDPEIQVLQQATKPEALSRQIDEAVRAGGPGSGRPGQAT